MKLSHVTVLGAITGLAQATPMAKRAVTNADILNYALTLEHLEATFYEQGLKNYTQEAFMKAGYKDPFYSNLKQVGSDEKMHEEFLTKALKAAGAHPVERCTYSFPATDPKSFLALASVLEGVGVSAYLGAAGEIMNKTYLTAAGSILTDEARHSAYLRAALKKVPFAQPFDNPLDLNEVYTVASPFIASCPSSNGKLPVKAFPALTMDSDKSLMTGSMVQLMADKSFDGSSAKDIHAAFITVTGPVWAELKDNGDNKYSVTIPKGVAGQSYVVLTKDNTKATDDNIVAGPAIVEIGQEQKMGGMGEMDGMSSMSMPSTAMSTSSMPSGSMTSGSMTSSSMMPSSSFNGAPGKRSDMMTSVLGGVFMAAAMLV
ncbi:hypothetical protein NUU61_002647 [Penicillium alfredii]|uniref:Uncharacterized protein n=1 Tax=Penicillium alfredii TaxID=1506179 RepID=A0A9W9KG83_9EURO|nr:uncharacterized protein NUU61_002647 [Penicillium alfredii]KAJ5105300.1 hypothetical protein NUU61_002647 [Penicillium alfredii]